MTTGNGTSVRVLLGMVMVLAGLTGCGDDKPSEASAGEPETNPAVVVEDAGDVPRSRLLFQVEEGQRAAMTLSFEMQMELAIDGQGSEAMSMPRTEMDMDLEVTDVSSDGNVTGSFEYTAVRVLGTGEAAVEMRRAVRPLVGVGGWVTTTPSGAYVDGSIEVPDDIPEPLPSMLRSMEEQLASLTVPLPAEPVGVGATWTATTRPALMGVEAEMSFRYTLVARQGDDLELEVSYEQAADEQPMDLPEMPEGASARLRSMRGSGEGTVRVSLGSLLPQSSTVTSQAAVEMHIDADGDSADMRQEIALDMELTER